MKQFFQHCVLFKWIKQASAPKTRKTKNYANELNITITLVPQKKLGTDAWATCANKHITTTDRIT